MTDIYNISPGFLVTYMTYQGKDKIDMKEVFKRLSLEMGGDGETISKKQLDDYINKADSGDIKVDSSKLKALKKIQQGWDNISGGKDSISYEDIEKYPTLLAATLSGGFTVTEIQDSNEAMSDAIYDYLAHKLGLSSKDEVTETHLNDYLKELISTSQDSDTNNELIGALTNLIASSQKTTTVEKEG